MTIADRRGEQPLVAARARRRRSGSRTPATRQRRPGPRPRAICPPDGGSAPGAPVDRRESHEAAECSSTVLQDQVEKHVRVAQRRSAARGRGAPRTTSSGALEPAQAPLVDEPAVDRAEARGERRVGRHAERGGLAVHRAAGAHDQVGGGHEARAVDRTRRARCRAARERLALLVGAREARRSGPRDGRAGAPGVAEEVGGARRGGRASPPAAGAAPRSSRAGSSPSSPATPGSSTWSAR